MQAIAIAIGIGLFLGGFFKLKKYGEQRTMMSAQMTMSGPLLMIISGSALLILPTFISTALLALWGNSNPLQYSGDTSGLGAFIPPILMFIRIIGVGSFIRGLVDLLEALLGFTN